MERVITSEERIRRAEEIYNRRKSQNGVRVSTSRVSTRGSTYKGKYTLYKKLIIQILACFLIYSTFYLIKNSNYIFSENFINGTRNFLSYDINFESIYNDVVNYYNNNLKFLFNIEQNEEGIYVNNEETNVIDENQNVEENGIGGGEEDEIKEVSSNENEVEQTVQLSQMEIDANDIKEKCNMILPLTGYTVTSRYGPRTPTDIVSANHAGIDIGANAGTVFVAAMEGKVTVASAEGSYGNHIFIENGDIITVYAHCKKLYVKEGDVVNQGQKIGEVGSTGNATGPHLHFEIRKNGRTVNPEYILNFG